MSANADQRDFWTDKAGKVWVGERAVMDDAFGGILNATLDRALIETGHSVLDIGCGAGTSTIAVAERIGETGHVTGIDISRTLLEAAQERALGLVNVGFLDADAQTHPFVPDSADVIISRFGVMFFADSIAAFVNMGLALRQNGRISFSCWGPIPDNPFFTLPAQVARQIIGPVPKSDPDTPGPFAFRDTLRIEAVMLAAGLDAQIETVQETLSLTGTPREIALTMCKIGPAQMALNHHNADEAQRNVLLSALEETLTPFAKDGGVHLSAAINYVTAVKTTLTKKSHGKST